MERKTKIINLGCNCTSTEVLQQFQEYVGRTPFDWCITDIFSVCKVVACLILNGVDDTVDKLYKNDFNIFNIDSPHFSEMYKGGDKKDDKKDKMERRVKRLYDSIIEKNSNKTCTYFVMIDNKKQYTKNDIMLLKGLLCLNSYRKLILLSHYDYSGFILENVEYTKLECLPQENYYHYPCVKVLTEKYGFVHTQRGAKWFRD